MFTAALAYIAVGLWFLWDEAKERGVREERLKRAAYYTREDDRAYERGRASAEDVATPRAAGDA